MASTENKEYIGHCHCEAYKFKLTMPELSGMSCDCSICSKKAYVWAFAGPDAFELINDGELVSYTFGKGSLTHKFCPTCGTAVLAISQKAGEEPQKAFNVRSLDGVDVTTINAIEYKGSELGDPYDRPQYEAAELKKDLKDGQKIYTGSCHCGAVKVGVRTKPFSEQTAIECNCSLCNRNGYVSLYPPTEDFSVDGAENTTAYIWVERPHLAHKFCKTCGVPVFIEVVLPPKSATADWDPKKLAEVEKDAGGRGVNIRVLNDVEWDKMKIHKYDGRSQPTSWKAE